MARAWQVMARTGLAALLGGARPVWAAAPAWQPHVGEGLLYRLSNGQTATTRVVRVESSRGQIAAEIERVTEGPGSRAVSQVRWLATDQGLAVAFGDPSDLPLERTPWLCLLWDARLRDGWVAQRGRYRDEQGESIEYRVLGRLEALETITVPAGTFSGCYHVRFGCQIGEGPPNAPSGLELWLHPAIGLIKSRSGSGARCLETELAGFLEP